MRYYTISIVSASQFMMTIVIEFGKFWCNFFHKGMCTSRDIFHSNVDKLLGDIECIKTYIDDILVFRKDCFTNHKEQMRVIFSRLCVSGLKFNACNCSFGLKEIHYLGYVITMESMKPNVKKLQVTMDIGRPTTTRESRALMGTVQ